MTQTQNEPAAKIGNWIASRLDKFEVILSVILIITFFLKMKTGIPIGILIVLDMMALAILYFFSAFANVNDEHAGSLEIFLYKLTSWAFSVGIIGILFTMENWHFSKFYLLSGSFTLLIALIVILNVNSRKPDLKLFDSRYILRIVIICCFGFLLAFTSHDLLVKNKIIKNSQIENVN